MGQEGHKDEPTAGIVEESYDEPDIETVSEEGVEVSVSEESVYDATYGNERSAADDANDDIDVDNDEFIDDVMVFDDIPEDMDDQMALDGDIKDFIEDVVDDVVEDVIEDVAEDIVEDVIEEVMEEAMVETIDEVVEGEEDYDDVFYLQRFYMPEEAMGVVTEKGFSVLKDSYICPYLLPSMYENVEYLRSKYALFIDEDNHLLVTLDFTDADQAAQFVVGKQADGMEEWKSDEGVSLKFYMHDD
jgi:hypothetical protein